MFQFVKSVQINNKKIEREIPFPIDSRFIPHCGCLFVQLTRTEVEKKKERKSCRDALKKHDKTRISRHIKIKAQKNQ